jgi:hypothetical protein
MPPIRLHDEARTKLEYAARDMSATEAADAVTGTPTSWFNGLDPATAWALVWIADTGHAAAFGELVGMSGRFGYRHARLLLGPPTHPSYSDPRTFDVVAEMVLRLAAELVPSSAGTGLPNEILTCHRYLATRTSHVVLGDTIAADDRERVLTVLHAALDLGFAVGVVEAHLAVGLPLAREHSG